MDVEHGGRRAIAVVGPPGCGKSTVARTLARRLGLPRIELDALAFAPDGSEVADDELRERLERELLAARAGWIVDGYHVRKLGDYVFRRADTVVWLDFALPVCLVRLLRRTLGAMVRGRETFRGAFVGRRSLFGWQLANHGPRRREIPALVAGRPDLELVHLRTPHAAARWLASLGDEHTRG